MSRHGGPPRHVAALPGSMLDLIWILLFFFLLISTIRRDRPEDPILVERVPVLSGAESPPAGDSLAVVVKITAGGGLLVDGQPIRRDRFPVFVSALARTPGPPARLILDVDRGATVEALLHAEDVARDAGLPCFVRRAPATDPDDADPG